MISTDPWPEAVRRAEEELGYGDPGIPRTVSGVRAALRPTFHGGFDADLATLSRGISFEVFLDEWWTQAVVDTAADDDGRDRALDFADLAVAFRISASGGPTMTSAEVAAMVGGIPGR